jgi:AcrR family transcriptional regulator
MLGTPKRDRIAERRAATRREILDAAWDLARDVGLAGLTLRDLAGRVGMQPPSLYSHFDSKNAIYDAMYGQAWEEYEALVEAERPRLPEHPREVVQFLARQYFDFATADLAKYQLTNQRIIPGFEPSPESYAPAVRVLEASVELFADLGVTREDFDIWLAILGGLIDQQHANDPGGDRFSRLLDRAIDMWADAVGLPPAKATPRKSGRTR